MDIAALTSPMLAAALSVLIFVPPDWWFLMIVGVGVFLGSVGGFMDANETHNGG